jgi:flagellar biosynthesis chaperone FliJ
MGRENNVMKLRIEKLNLKFKKTEEVIDFGDITYFYGQMGAGKTSIAKLVDFCLGGNLEYSPALQQEFISAELILKINDKEASFLRPRDSNKLIANGFINDESLNLVIPITPEGELIEGTGIENLSDFIYYLAGITPPKVRRSKKKEDSELQRLSLRSLLWYCYLDQDHIDSDFFHLNLDGHVFKRHQSKDVLRHVVGFHQEKVTELEMDLEELRNEKRKLKAAADTLESVLEDTGIQTSEKIIIESANLNKKLVETKLKISELMAKEVRTSDNHIIDEIRVKAQYLFSEIQALEDSIKEIRTIIEKDQAHLNELKMLKLKVRRDTSAKSILRGVSFNTCPSCTKSLPPRLQNECIVCGQDANSHQKIDGEHDYIALEKDADARIKELSHSILNHKSQLKKILFRTDKFVKEKKQVDANLDQLLDSYNSAYLSNILSWEKTKYEIEEKLNTLDQLSQLPSRVDSLRTAANSLLPDIEETKDELTKCREKAEKDTKNLELLQTIFLECLVEAKIPGIKETDSVHIESPNFLPEVLDSNISDLAVTSFSNLSSGGKKTLFKCCFAIAFHILAQRIGALLPSLLILDSPMKNISERENKEVFESFMNMIYRLSTDELKDTQIIIIDKELFTPRDDLKKVFKSRHMQPSSKEFPPLIPYYLGH